jgi:dienelactone hydrolase
MARGRGHLASDQRYSLCHWVPEHAPNAFGRPRAGHRRTPPSRAGPAALASAGCGGSDQSADHPATTPAANAAGVTPPAATGPSPVGFERRTLTDRHRTERVARGGAPRRVPLRVGYPASAPGAQRAPVVTAAEQSFLEAGAKVPAGSLDGLGGASTAAAPPAPGPHPVLLLSPGLGTSTAQRSAQATDLAGHGYVVIGIDHPGDATVVDLGGGQLVRQNPALKHGSERSVAVRVQDVRFVLGQLSTIRGAGRLDLAHIGVFGHSNGGAAAAGAMLADRRLDAGINLDGGIFGAVATRGLDRPFGTALGGGPALAYESVTTFRQHLRGPCPLVRFRDTGHLGFTDMVWLTPKLHLEPAELGTVAPPAAVAEQRSFLLAFFDRYLGR